MNKFLFLFFVFVNVAFGAEAANGELLLSYSALAAGVGLGIAAAGGAIGMGHAASATISGTARNPGIGGKLMATMFIAIAMIEAQVIYTLVVALVLLFANPFAATLGL